MWGLVARTYEGYVGAFVSGVASDDEVGGVGSVALRWEGVLYVCEAEVRVGQFACMEAQLGAVRKAQLELARSRIDVGDHAGGAITQLALVVVPDRAADLNVVARV
jgi:hypothetical protein